MRRVCLSLLPLLFLVPALDAQNVTVGVDIASPNSSDITIASWRTDVSLDHPANIAGVINKAKFGWSQAGCRQIAFIRFFRRNGNTLTKTAERGPFDSGSGGIVSVDLFPAVNVSAGDLIGISREWDCGNPTAMFGMPGNGFIAFPGFNGDTIDLSSGTAASSPLALYGSGTTAAGEIVAGLLPVVGSVTGSFGSNFKTSLQLLNGVTGNGTLTGRLIFHPAGAPAGASDPSMPFSIPPKSIVSFPDAVAAMGRTGLGSLDVAVPQNQPMPVIVARIFNDAGAAGTSGFTEEVVNPNASALESKILRSGSTGCLVTPTDPLKTRFNIGVRSFDYGALITVTLIAPNGGVRKSVSKSYPANFFEQTDAATFLGGTAVGGNEWIYIEVTQGTLIVYGTTTDNVTNDPAIQFSPVMTVRY